MITEIFPIHLCQMQKFRLCLDEDLPLIKHTIGANWYTIILKELFAYLIFFYVVLQ